MLNAFDLCATGGALLAMTGAVAQMQQETATAITYMRRARTLDPEGSKAAKKRRIRFGYKEPEKLEWMSRQQGRHQWIRRVGPTFYAWALVALGAYLLAIASFKPYPIPADLRLFWFGIVGLVIVFAVSAILSSVADADGVELAEADWCAARTIRLGKSPCGTDQHEGCSMPKRSIDDNWAQAGIFQNLLNP